MDLNEELEMAAALREDAKSLDERAKIKREESAKLRSHVKERIDAGESTGDRVLDFCLRVFGDTDEVELLKQIDKDIAEHPNELVVVSKVDFDRHTFRDGADQEPRRGDYYRKHSVWLGIIPPDAEGLILEGSTLFVPVKKVVYAGERGLGNATTDPIELRHWELYALGGHAHIPFDDPDVKLTDGPIDYGLWIAAGNEAVDNWFVDQAKLDRKRYFASEEDRLQKWADFKTKLLEALEPVFVEQELEF